ncbi:MAG: hypothetical protein KAU58_03010, partial [Candidatus Omnitrophica bacterium]|nr:hypothetical protein [Candidatus Omnitrophota bacterium]
MILLSFFGDLDRKNLEPDDYGQALLVSYFGILPVVFKYLTRSLKKDIVLAPLERAIAGKLIELGENGMIINPINGREDNNILSYAYYFGGEASWSAGDFDKAITYCEKSGHYDETFPAPHTVLAISLVRRDGTIESVEEAYRILDSAEKKFGPRDIFDSARKYIGKVEKWILTCEKTLKLFKQCDYDGCREIAVKTLKSAGKMGLPVPLTASLKSLRQRARLVAKLKDRGIESFCNGDYTQAKECFEQVLRENPADEQVSKLHGQIPALIKEKKKAKKAAGSLKKYLQNAERFCFVADGQIISGRIGRARKNYERALAELDKARDPDETILRMQKEISKKLVAINSLPDRVVREKEKVGLLKKKKRRQGVVVKESELPQETKDSVNVEGTGRKAFLSKEVVDRLGKKKLISHKDQKSILSAIRVIKQATDEDMRRGSLVNLHGNLWSKRVGKLNVVFIIMDDGNILLLLVGKPAETTRKKVINIFPKDFDYRPILENAVKIEEIVEYMAMKGIDSKIGEGPGLDGKWCCEKSSADDSRSAREKARDVLVYFNDQLEVVRDGEKILKVDMRNLKVPEQRVIFENRSARKNRIFFKVYIDFISAKYGKVTVGAVGNVLEIWQFSPYQNVERGQGLGNTIMYYLSRLAAEKGRLLGISNTSSKFLVHLLYKYAKDIEGYYNTPEGKISIAGKSEKETLSLLEKWKELYYLRGTPKTDEEIIDYMARKSTPVERKDRILPEVSWNGEEIVKNAKSVIPWLVQAMIDISENISDKKKDEKVVLLLDVELAELSQKDIGSEIERLIRVLTDIESNNADLKRFLKNLRIVKGKGKNLLNKKGTAKAENIIVVTKSSNVEYFESIK